MPDFSERFRRKDNVGDQGFNDGFSDDFDDGFNDSYGESASETNDGFSDYTDENGGYGSVSGEDGQQTAEAASGKASEREPDFRKSFAALFGAIADRFSGKNRKIRSAGVDSSDASFAEEFDSSLDEGFAVPEDDLSVRQTEASDRAEEAPERTGQAEYAGYGQPQDRSGAYDGRQSDAEMTFAGYAGGFGNPPYSRQTDNRDEHSVNGRREDTGGYPWDDSGNDSAYSDRDMPDEDDSEQSSGGEGGSRSAPEEGGPEMQTEGLLAAIMASWAKFRRRLPSFRPKVYSIPEPEYTPEQDGIETPSLARDIRRILEEQNKPGETEQAYDQMRSYIRSVSTDARLRPEDIRQPENIDQVREAENELFDLINMIDNTNEQQRSRIGVYEKPPEEDPYNFRGINDNRYLYTDMEAYSFDMKPSYGFECEEKIDPGRKAAEMEYNRIYAPMTDQPPEPADFPASGGTQESFEDGFDDDLDFGDDADDTSREGTVREAAGRPGGVPDIPDIGGDDGLNDDFDDGFDGNLNDDFDDDFDKNFDRSFHYGFHPSYNGYDDGFDDGFDDDLSGEPVRRGSRAKGRPYENPDRNAAVEEGFVDYRSKRKAERETSGRRGRR